MNNQNSHVDLGKIIKLRYDGYIANQIIRLTDGIKSFFNSNTDFISAKHLLNDLNLKTDK